MCVWCVCRQCINGCLESFVVGDVGVERCDVIVTRMGLCGSGVGIWKMVLRKCLVSLM